MVTRVFVEKRKGFDVEARHMMADLRQNLGLKAIEDLRILNRYDVSGLSGEEFEAAAIDYIKRTLRDHERIIFNGDGYADAWKAEAAKRGLTNLPTTVDALPHYTDEKNVKLFTKHKIYNEVEMKSRQNIVLET